MKMQIISSPSQLGRYTTTPDPKLWVRFPPDPFATGSMMEIRVEEIKNVEEGWQRRRKSTISERPKIEERSYRIEFKGNLSWEGVGRSTMKECER